MNIFTMHIVRNNKSEQLIFEPHFSHYLVIYQALIRLGHFVTLSMSLIDLSRDSVYCFLSPPIYLPSAL